MSIKKPQLKHPHEVGQPYLFPVSTHQKVALGTKIYCCDSYQTKTENRCFLSELCRTIWSQVNMVSPSGVCVYIRYKANESVQQRRLKVPSKSMARLNFHI